MENNIRFRRKAQVLGDSIGITIPKEIVEHLGIEKADELILIVDINKKGQKYGAFFKDD